MSEYFEGKPHVGHIHNCETATISPLVHRRQRVYFRAIKNCLWSALSAINAKFPGSGCLLGFSMFSTRSLDPGLAFSGFLPPELFVGHSSVANQRSPLD